MIERRVEPSKELGDPGNTVWRYWTRSSKEFVKPETTANNPN